MNKHQSKGRFMSSDPINGDWIISGPNIIKSQSFHRFWGFFLISNNQSHDREVAEFRLRRRIMKGGLVWQNFSSSGTCPRLCSHMDGTQRVRRCCCISLQNEKVWFLYHLLPGGHPHLWLPLLVKTEIWVRRGEISTLQRWYHWCEEYYTNYIFFLF